MKCNRCFFSSRKGFLIYDSKRESRVTRTRCVFGERRQQFPKTKRKILRLRAQWNGQKKKTRNNIHPIRSIIIFSAYLLCSVKKIYRTKLAHSRFGGSRGRSKTWRFLARDVKRRTYSEYAYIVNVPVTKRIYDKLQWTRRSNNIIIMFDMSAGCAETSVLCVLKGITLK